MLRREKLYDTPEARKGALIKGIQQTSGRQLVMWLCVFQLIFAVLASLAYHWSWDSHGEAKRVLAARMRAKKLDILRLAAMKDGGVWQGPGAGFLVGGDVGGTLEPPVSAIQGPKLKELMTQAQYSGAWSRLSRPKEVSGEGLFTAMRNRCLETVAEQRQTAQTARLPTPLPVLARHASVEPADCAGCARPACSLQCGVGTAVVGRVVCCSEMLASMLEVVGSWLQSNGVTHFITGGTLLGAINDKQVHEWNEGASIAVEAGSLSRLREMNPDLLRRGVAYFVNQERSQPSFLAPMSNTKWLDLKGELCLTVDITTRGLSIPEEMKRAKEDLSGTRRKAIVGLPEVGRRRQESAKGGLLYSEMEEIAARDYQPWMTESETRQHPHIVLLPYYEAPGGEDIIIQGAHTCQRRLKRDKVFPLSTITMNKMDWPVPRFANEALCQFFGPDFRDKGRIDRADEDMHLSYCRENDL